MPSSAQLRVTQVRTDHWTAGLPPNVPLADAAGLRPGCLQGFAEGIGGVFRRRRCCQEWRVIQRIKL